MKELGDFHYCLGIASWRESGKTIITQIKYAREILDRFQMSESNLYPLLWIKMSNYTTMMDLKK